ncbi:MAG: phage head morphogenesis protein, partial [Bacteroidetes bacterium]|nr:phage head morphogenesis protein [Bacteroidota bacterium]
NEIFIKISLNIEGYCYEIDSLSIRHILKQHGDKNKEKQLKEIAVTKKDILLIPEIFENYHNIQKVTKKTKRGTYSILFIKQIGKKYYVVGELRKKKKTLALKTMYIKRSSL